jgi:hypothetical protein
MAKLKTYRVIASETHVFKESVEARSEEEAREKFLALMQEGMDHDDAYGFQIDHVYKEE